MQSGAFNQVFIMQQVLIFIRRQNPLVHHRLTHCIAVAVALVHCAGVFAQSPVAHVQSPVAHVIASTGNPPTNAEGVVFPAGFDAFSIDLNGVPMGGTVLTPRRSSATIFASEYDLVIQLGGNSEVRLDPVSDPEMDIPFSIQVVSGTVQVLRPASENRWLLIFCKTRRNSGYTVSKNASLAVTRKPQEAVFCVLSGAAMVFAGDVPGKLTWNDEGALDQPDAIEAGAGEEVSTETLAKVSNAEMLLAMADTLYGDWEAFGIDQTEQWVISAERGDFTPVRGSSRAAVDSFSSELAVQQQAFDQPRSIVIAPSPNVVISTVTGAAASPAQSLIESGVPSSVIVGQRFRRTRIIGNPGTSGAGPIRFNPFAEQLIRLPGSRGNRGR